MIRKKIIIYMVHKVIIEDDAIHWLKSQKDHSLDNVVTGICDLDETDYSFEKYINFFNHVAELIFQKSKGYVIFIQTDRKYKKTWIDKSFLLTDVATDQSYRLMWHKICLLREVNRSDLHRPTYSHVLCYSQHLGPGESTPDVLPVSKRLYKNGTPLGAAELAIQFVKRYNPGVVVDPFVGRGTITSLANKHGLDAIGIDLDPKQVEYAKHHTL